MCRKGRSTFIGGSPQGATLFIRLSAKIKTVICEQAPNHGSYFAYVRLIARVTFNLLVFILILRMEICEGGAVRQFPEHPGVDPNEKRNGYSG